MPKKQEDQEEQEVSIPTVNVDCGVNGKGESMTEVLCMPTSIKVTQVDIKDKDGNVTDTRVTGGEIVFTDVDGNKHESTFDGKTPIFRLFQKVSDYALAEELVALDGRKRTAFMKKAFAGHDPIIARIRENGELFCTVTQKWKKNDIENLLPVIEEIFEGNDINVTSSTGSYGGKAVVTLADADFMTPRVVISMGPKDGQHSVKILSAGKILACENMMTVDVRHAVRGLIPNDSAFYLAQKHSGNILDESLLRGQLMDAKAAAMELSGVLETAQGRILTEDQVRGILRYYHAERVLSARSASTILGYYSDPEVTQVPDSHYGLIMAVTYFGTHEPELKDGVRHKANTLGGELAVVAGDEAWAQFMPLVEERVAGLEKDIFAVPEEVAEEKA